MHGHQYLIYCLISDSVNVLFRVTLKLTLKDCYKTWSRQNQKFLPSKDFPIMLLFWQLLLKKLARLLFLGTSMLEMKGVMDHVESCLLKQHIGTVQLHSLTSQPHTFITKSPVNFNKARKHFFFSLI